MSTKAKHTPVPWSMALRIKQRHETVDSYFFGPKKSSEQWLGDVSGKTNAEAAANAEFIVLACNAHEDVVKALEGILEWHDKPPFDPDGVSMLPAAIAAVRAALAKARGE